MDYFSYNSLFSSYAKILSILYPEKSKRNRVRLIDIGCQHGTYSFDFARMGFNVTGLEVRDCNYNVCIKNMSKHAGNNISFIKDDCWNIQKYGTFDIIFCSGLLYHLDRPIEYLKILSDVCDKLLILNTHFVLKDKVGKHYTGDIVINEGVYGRWFEEVTSNSQAAWSNDKSFWVVKEDLIGSLRKVGFDTVLEQFDGYDKQYLHEEYTKEQRSTFIGIKI